MKLSCPIFQDLFLLLFAKILLLLSTNKLQGQKHLQKSTKCCLTNADFHENQRASLTTEEGKITCGHKSTLQFNSLSIPHDHIDSYINNISSYSLVMEVLVVKFEYRDNEEKIFWLLCMTVCVDYLDYKLRHLYWEI